MNVRLSVLSEVRKRADFSCEYCGISETDSGGELTVDHFQPRSKDGSDDYENLVYSCYRCNAYKGDYWSQRSDQIPLWNPRSDSRDAHFWVSDNGKIYSLTVIGEFAIGLLRLNRQPLVTKRQRQFRDLEEHLVLVQFE